MLGMFYLTRRLLALLLSAVLLIGVPAAPDGYEPLTSDDCLMNFTVVSDVHMETNNKISRDAFIRELYNIKANPMGNDALVLLGDNTMNCQHLENLFLYGILAQIKPADEVYITVGNHDVGNGEGQYQLKLSRTLSYYNTFYNDTLRSPYYIKDCGGYSMIFLGPQQECSNYAMPTSEQLEWLSDALDACEGRPAFIFSHHPYYRFGAWYDELISVLSGHENVFMFTGHMHAYSIFYEALCDGVYHFNLPRVTEQNDDGSVCDSTGLGLSVEVYEDEVVVRERNFYTGSGGESYHFELAA